MENSADDADSSSPVTGKRQRAKQACEPCRLRKRRCDGAMPCNMCRSFEYKCYFEKHSRKRSKLVEQNAHHELSDDYVRPEPPQHDWSTAEDTLKTRYMEANSGQAFVRLLGQRLDPSSGVKLSKFGWNLGTAYYEAPPPTPITDYLDQHFMYTLANDYFTHMHHLYGFLDKEWILQQIALRWTQPEQCTVPDHLFANLAAVGSLFSKLSHESVIAAIVEAGKKALGDTSLMQPPTLLDIQSWLLRFLYLRATDHAHASHTASSIVMHLIEGIGLHEEVNNAVLHPVGAEPNQSAETRRRTFWIARIFNTWVCYEYGRNRVTLRGITTELPTPRDGDYTVDFIKLYSLSCSLDPEKPESQWEDVLRQLDEFEAKHDVIALSKANLCVCIYRRIRLQNPNPSLEILNRIIKIGLCGLEAARRLCEQGMPWWHVANIPFQAICIFLAMDVRESLSHIATAMHVLEEVVERFPTAAMKDALNTARFLVRLSKRRKDEDAQVLGQSLKQTTTVDGDSEPEVLQMPPIPTTMNGHVPAAQIPMPVPANSADWNFDAINNSAFDWNFFLTADMPALSGFAPDGIM